MPEPENWERVKEIFAHALELEGEERDAYVREACGDDALLREDVESWLMSHDEAASFIEEPATSLHLGDLNRTAVGREYGNYTIVREIGIGGMGAVFLAERNDHEFDQQVALKIIRQSLADSHLIERFRRERQILASLDHPNIARLLDGGVSANGEPFLAMEFVDGVSILDHAEQHQLSLRDKLNAFLKVCAAVAYAHRNLVVHRDIKPGNILVNESGEPKLLDFGLARLAEPDTVGGAAEQTQTGFRALTPAYASPEQLKGEAITTSSDIYSLGVVLSELLTGERPFKLDGMSLDSMIRTISTSEPNLPSRSGTADGRLKGDLDNIILKALKTQPERRYRSVEQLAEDIQRYLDGLPVRARKDTLRYRAGKFVMRHRIATAAAALVLLTIVTGVTLTVREKRKADRRFNDVRQLANSLMFEVDTEIQKGPTKGRALLAKRALEYLDSLALESGNESDLQLELAAGYLKVGDTQGKPYRPNLGDTVGAEASYHKARVLLESIVARTPKDREAKRNLSLTYQSLGRVQERNNEWAEALESEGKAVELSEQLTAADPRDPELRNLLADNYLHYGEALYQTGRGAVAADHYQAIEYFRKALEIHSALSNADPSNADYRYATGVDYEYIGIAYNRLGDMTGDATNHQNALDNHLRELEINNALAAADPSNAAYRRIVADVYGEVGLSQMKLGKTADGLENFRHRLNIFESIKASDPSNVEAIRDVVNSLKEIAEAMAKLDDRTGAVAQLQKAAALTETLAQAEPDNTNTRQQLASIKQMIADLSR